MAPFLVEPFGDSHDRTSFDCGIEPLDRYFRQQVSQDIKRRITNCFVALDPQGVIAGYYTFAATGLPMNKLSAAETKRLPRYPLLPAGLIGRLAVDKKFRGQGLGSALIVDALMRAVRAEPAIYALVVDAKDETALDFYRHLGFRQFASRPMSLFLAIATAADRLKSH